MELDELKYELKNKLSGRQDKSTVDLTEMLHAKTSSVISKLKRSLRLEMVFAIVFTLIFAYIGLFNKHWSLRIYFGVFSIVFTVFSFIIAYLLKKTTQLTSTELSIKTNLQTLVTILNEYIKRNFQLTMGLLPVCFVFSFWLGYNEPTPSMPGLNNTLMHTFKSKAQVNIFLVIYFVGLAIGLYYFTKWYLKKLYGNYISELKAYIAELEKD